MQNINNLLKYYDLEYLQENVSINKFDSNMGFIVEFQKEKNGGSVFPWFHITLAPKSDAFMESALTMCTITKQDLLNMADALRKLATSNWPE